MKHKASIEVFLDHKLKNEVEKLFAFDFSTFDKISI